MISQRHLSRAPITEALLDIRVAVNDSTSLDSFSAFYDKVKQRYPIKSEQRSVKIGFDLNDAPPTVSQEKKGEGFLYKTQDGNQIVQARLDGFTFNRLKPYEDWKTLKNESKKLWSIYAEVAKPVKLTRLALRYINHLDLPLPMRDFKDYILTGPEISANLTQGIEEGFLRVVIPKENDSLKAILTVAIKKPIAKENLHVVPVIFDIDVFKPCDLNSNDEMIWKFFEDMHDFKNQLFFGSLTEKTLEMYK